VIVTPATGSADVIETLSGKEDPGEGGSVELIAGVVVTCKGSSVEHPSEPFFFLQSDSNARQHTTAMITNNGLFMLIFFQFVLK